MPDNTSNSEQIQYECSKCKKNKVPDDFYKDRSRYNGLQAVCKICTRENVKNWQKENPERVKENAVRWQKENPERVKELNRRWYKENTEKRREKDKRWREENPEKHREGVRRWEKKNPERVLENRLKLRYGISLEVYDSMLVAQRGVCAICGEVCSSGKRLSVDHDHVTGKIRGLLCAVCNKKLGIVESFMEQALEYLNRNRN